MEFQAVPLQTADWQELLHICSAKKKLLYDQFESGDGEANMAEFRSAYAATVCVVPRSIPTRYRAIFSTLAGSCTVLPSIKTRTKYVG